MQGWCWNLSASPHIDVAEVVRFTWTRFLARPGKQDSDLPSTEEFKLYRQKSMKFICKRENIQREGRREGGSSTDEKYEE